MPATGQADIATSFTFEGRSSLPDEASLQAQIAALDPEAPTPAAPAAKADEPPVAAATATPDVTAQPVTPLPANPEPAGDLRTHEITVDGQKLTVTEADLKAGHMRQQDYTRKTQALAAEKAAMVAREQQYQAEVQRLQSEQAQIDAFLRNQQAIDAYRAKAFGNPLPVPQIDPSQPPTAQQVAEISAYNAEQARIRAQQDFNAQIEQLRQETHAVTARAQAAVVREKITSDVDHHIASLTSKYPILTQVSEDIGEELIGDALRMGPPPDMETAKARLTQVAERRVAALNKIQEDARKAVAVQQATMKKNSPEPPGGAPPKPAPGRKLSLDPRDRSAMVQAGVEDLQAFLGQ